MIKLFQDQEHRMKLHEEAKQRKQDFALRNQLQLQARKDASVDIPYQHDSIKDDLKNSIRAFHGKKCKENLQLCEESLGKELGESKKNAERQEKMRQLLWETSPELRDLRLKFLMADVAKDQAMQIAEKQALLELKQKEIQAEAEAISREKKKMEEELKEQQALEFRARQKYHRELAEQQNYKAAKETVGEEQQRRERSAIDEIKKKIEEEDFINAKKKIEAQKELHRQALELQNVRKEMQRLEKLKEGTEDMKIDEYRKAQELRAKEIEEKKQLTTNQRLQLQEELLSHLEEMYAEKSRQELLRTELAIEEKEAYEREKAEDSERAKADLREQFAQLHKIQLYIKKQKEEQQKKEDELFRENLMARLYEEEKLEFMSQQKRRQKQLEHRRLAQKMIEEKNKRKAMERAREMADLEYHKEIEFERRKMVEEERARFLKDHAKELLGYLPKGVFKNDEELERLGEEFRQFYSRKSCSY
ncbi:meiosis-specific nuclear structural protein 1-like [Stegodyphus dumicola]|uniref:meiosis-specific nuclear structural protein 1-like n=1 Tax=Stegodyphus dumicola TaxID=202533 RepID=UPI0015AAA343|nr:meiosis-specific nuclear structural protein 1-like [Stegodyphus dumicola]